MKNRHVLYGVLGLALLGGAAAGHPVDHGSHTGRIARTRPSPAGNVVSAFHKALASGDAATAANLIDQRATIFEEGYVERGKADYVASHLPADIEFSRAVHEALERRDVVAGTDMAVVTSESRLTGTFKDKAVDRLSVETVVLRRGPAGWRIVHIHWSGRPAPKASS